ncbi:MAG: competence protein TfoX [Gammaproteobacteria bacterium]|nr:competence protein TfoX [Gammaproteobacteria bacterium]
MSDESLVKLKNIGKTVATRLHEIGVSSKSELKQTGSVEAYRRLSQAYPDKHLPFCYYLYSLEGAIKNCHWNDFSEKEKQSLRDSAMEPEL